jgi:hypothetical protein
LQKMCSRVSTFEVKATLVGDLNEWMAITLDDAHASTVVGQSASSCPPPLWPKISYRAAGPILSCECGCAALPKSMQQSSAWSRSLHWHSTGSCLHMTSDERSSWCQPQDPTEPAPPLPHSRCESIHSRGVRRERRAQVCRAGMSTRPRCRSRWRSRLDGAIR